MARRRRCWRPIPAARTLCGARRARLVGAPLSTLFEPLHAERLQNLVAAARTVGRQDALRAQLAGAGDEVSVSASVFRQDDAAFVLVRLAPVRAEPPQARLRSVGAQPQGAETGAEAMLQAYLRSSPDGLVFCDAGGRVLMANRAFVALAQLNAEEQVRGQALDRWIGRTGVELGVLIATSPSCSSPSPGSRRCGPSPAAWWRRASRWPAAGR
jgi:transcriptional regulator with PAS, ATPase and Fis domain